MAASGEGFCHMELIMMMLSFEYINIITLYENMQPEISRRK
jgi:hypothetical protein